MEKFYILDASGYLYRAYFAIRNMTNKAGESTNALFGFIRSLLKLIEDFRPTHLIAVFDGKDNQKSRNEIYKDYKAHRSEIPQDLPYQIEWAKQFCNIFGIPYIAVEGVEADDTIGSIAQWAARNKQTVYLCTSDKDLCQMVSDNIFILNTHKDNLIIDRNKVEEIHGVPPEKIIDLLAMTGDSSDNVPGISGFGPKTSAHLLNEFGSLEYILNHPECVKGDKKKQTLIDEKERALLSKRLVSLNLEVDFPKDLNYFRLQKYDKESLKTFYEKFHFHSLLKEIEESVLLPTDEIQNCLQPLIPSSYHLINDKDSFYHLISLLENSPEICFDTETTNIHPLKATLVGIGFGVKEKEAYYIPFNGNLSKETIIEKIKPIFQDSSKKFFGHNVKYDYHILANEGIEVGQISFDTILASYLLNAHLRKHSLDHLAFEYFHFVKTPIESLIGKGKKEISMREVPIEKVCDYCCEDIDYTFRLKKCT